MTPYEKLARAYKRGTGLRLSPKEVWELVRLDDAIHEVVTSLNGNASEDDSRDEEGGEA